MYSWIFRKLILGPIWLKLIQTLIILAGLTYLCFEYVYPWIQEYFELAENTV